MDYVPKFEYGTPTEEFSENIKTVSPNGTIVICARHPIPPGFVIVGVTTNLQCSTRSNNALIIKRPGPQKN